MISALFLHYNTNRVLNVRCYHLKYYLTSLEIIRERGTRLLLPWYYLEEKDIWQCGRYVKIYCNDATVASFWRANTYGMEVLFNFWDNGWGNVNARCHTKYKTGLYVINKKRLRWRVRQIDFKRFATTTLSQQPTNVQFYQRFWLMQFWGFYRHVSFKMLVCCVL